MSGKSYVAGIDIGGTNFRLGLVDRELKVHHFEKKSSTVLAAEGNGVPHLIREITAYLDAHCSREEVAAVAIGFPSIVSKDRTTLYSTPNLPGFDGVDVVSPLQEALGLPVFIERDVNFLLQNDIQQLKLDPSHTILGFYVGTGFGNALYLDGKFYTGKNGVAGELGHIPLYGLDRRCNCGNLGCSEILCSGMGLRAIAETHFPGEDFSRLFLEHGDAPVLRQFVADLAIPIATELTLLDPDTAVLAGGVIAMEGFPREELIRFIKERTRKPYPAENLDLRFSKHTQQSGVIGGGIYGWQKL
ncbi:allose kinase [Zongyangia hominis]|uniref:Allose kinase n=1 Tax=Zongyangia hominis TaxID=2763677 RepID=A0A926EBS6_9FIRM|nr:allose kinase [Zongyangia hominis]MBC8570175.1 allose kinase [Zongyangia hominis]